MSDVLEGIQVRAGGVTHRPFYEHGSCVGPDAMPSVSPCTRPVEGPTGDRGPVPSVLITSPLGRFVLSSGIAGIAIGQLPKESAGPRPAVTHHVGPLPILVGEGGLLLPTVEHSAPRDTPSIEPAELHAGVKMLALRRLHDRAHRLAGPGAIGARRTPGEQLTHILVADIGSIPLEQ